MHHAWNQCSPSIAWKIRGSAHSNHNARTFVLRFSSSRTWTFHKTRCSIMHMFHRMFRRSGLLRHFLEEAPCVQGTKNNNLNNVEKQCYWVSNRDLVNETDSEAYRSDALFPAKGVPKPHTWQHNAHQLEWYREHKKKPIIRRIALRSKWKDIDFVVEAYTNLSCGHNGGKREGTKCTNCVRNEELTGGCYLQGIIPTLFTNSGHVFVPKSEMREGQEAKI